MAKQTFTTGQVLTAAQMTSLQQTAMLGGAASAKVASYVLVAADAGDAITMNNAGATTITANTGLFATGDIVTIINIGAGACTITAGTATVTTSGSLVLAQNQGGVLRFTSPSEAIFLQFATPASGDIEGVTAGTGISGGGTSGTVTITNSMATAITTNGDIIYGTGSGTFARLGIGTTGQVLNVAAGVPAWATPAGGSMTSIASGSLSGASVTLSSIPTTYKRLELELNGVSQNNNDQVYFRVNGLTGSNYFYVSDNSSNLNTQGTGATSFTFNGQNADGGNTSAAYNATFHNPASTTGWKLVDLRGAWLLHPASTKQASRLSGGVETLSAVTSLEIIAVGGTFDSGTYTLYGVN